MTAIESLAKAACNAATRSGTQGEFVALNGIKQAVAKAWRDRVEVLAHNGKGKVFGGIWDSDKSFSLPGGGIEANEDAAKAALRELKEEAGLQGKNPVVLPIEPVQEKWTDKQRKESGRDFAGSRTRFVAVEVAKKLPKVKLDKWDAKDKGYYTWQEALESMKQKKFFSPVIAKSRIEALEYMSKKADLQDDVKLQEHQQRIIDRMNAGDKRLLLYHGLGSGKSLSSLAAAEAAGGNYGAVTPAALRPNYEKEIEKFTEGTEPDVLSYSGLGAGKQFKQPVDTVIFDEAHRLRNPGTAATQAAKQLARNTKNLLLLTGTPITNQPNDLASLLSLLHNKNISPEQFDKEFVGHKKVYPTFLSRFTGQGVGEQPYVKNEAKLRELLKGKIDYQPSKTPEGVNVKEEVVKVPLSPDQQHIQKAIKSGMPPEWAWKLNKEFPLSQDELKSLNSFLTGLRQSSLSTLPFRGDKKPITAFEESGKLQRALKDLKSELGSDPRKKSIIYSNYIDAGLSPYAAALEREKIPYGMFHGGIPLKQRKQNLQDYNEGKLRALLLGPAAAEGISTKGTNLIQLLDPHWHESRSSQARGRGLRFDSHTGLPEELKNVAVKRYISESKDPSWLGRLLGEQRQRTGDEILQTLAADKEKLNDVFRKILQEEGTPMKRASDSVASTLQKLVFNCISLALQFKHCHWNVRGTMFKPLHDFLDEVHETLESTSDDLAERLVTLDQPADGNPSEIAANSSMEALPLQFMQPATIVDDLTTRLKALCDMFNAAIKTTSSDPVTSNMLQDMTHQLEKHLWMLRSQKDKADEAQKEAAFVALSRLLGR